MLLSHHKKSGHCQTRSFWVPHAGIVERSDNEDVKGSRRSQRTDDPTLHSTFSGMGSTLAADCETDPV